MVTAVRDRTEKKKDRQLQLKIMPVVKEGEEVAAQKRVAIKKWGFVVKRRAAWCKACIVGLQYSLRERRSNRGGTLANWF